MKKTISTMDVRRQLGEILDRVALRYDEFVIERKGKALAAVVPIEKLEQLERAARSHLLSLFERQRSSLSEAEAEALSDVAKHQTRRSSR